MWKQTCCRQILMQTVRIPSTEAHAKTASYLLAKFKSFGGEVQVQQVPVETYDGKTHQLKNIIAAFYPAKKQRILITAHWDTRPFSDQEYYARQAI